jgi:hypothetical protein
MSPTQGHPEGQPVPAPSALSLEATAMKTKERSATNDTKKTNKKEKSFYHKESFSN